MNIYQLSLIRNGHIKYMIVFRCFMIWCMMMFGQGLYNLKNGED
jgi:hypothetical protein